MAFAFSTVVALRGEQTGDAISVTENTLPARWDGPPRHHHEFDEAFYVVDGELTFQLGDALFTAGPGALAFAPGGVEHTLANLADARSSRSPICPPRVVTGGVGASAHGGGSSPAASAASRAK